MRLVEWDRAGTWIELKPHIGYYSLWTAIKDELRLQPSMTGSTAMDATVRLQVYFCLVASWRGWRTVRWHDEAASQRERSAVWKWSVGETRGGRERCVWLRVWWHGGFVWIVKTGGTMVTQQTVFFLFHYKKKKEASHEHRLKQNNIQFTPSLIKPPVKAEQRLSVPKTNNLNPSHCSHAAECTV